MFDVTRAQRVWEHRLGTRIRRAGSEEEEAVVLSFEGISWAEALQ